VRPASDSLLRRRATLAAFIVLLLLPAPVASVMAVALLAVGAVRAARRTTRRLTSSKRGKDGIVIGVDRRRRLVRLGYDELSAHGLIVGASGAG
jgi:hypothetical protein